MYITSEAIKTGLRPKEARGGYLVVGTHQQKKKKFCFISA